MKFIPCSYYLLLVIAPSSSRSSIIHHAIGSARYTGCALLARFPDTTSRRNYDRYFGGVKFRALSLSPTTLTTPTTAFASRHYTPSSSSSSSSLTINRTFLQHSRRTNTHRIFGQPFRPPSSSSSSPSSLFSTASNQLDNMTKKTTVTTTRASSSRGRSGSGAVVDPTATTSTKMEASNNDTTVVRRSSRKRNATSATSSSSIVSISNDDVTIKDETKMKKSKKTTTRTSKKTTNETQKEKTKKKKTNKKSNDNTKEAPTPKAIDISSEVPWYTQMFTKGDVEYDTYMAKEWGYEKHGDVPIFEKLCLEGAQSGLSWLTILRKRTAYRETFYNFDIEKVAAMTNEDIERILTTDHDDKRQIVVRHRGKIEAVINNAKCIQRMYNEEDEKKKKKTVGGTTQQQNDLFDNFIWSFVNHQPILNYWNGKLGDAPTKTVESEAMSKSLKQLGFKFVGPTTCYAMMQSIGMVIDHPYNTKEWLHAKERLEQRIGGYQDRKP